MFCLLTPTSPRMFVDDVGILEEVAGLAVDTLCPRAAFGTCQSQRTRCRADAAPTPARDVMPLLLARRRPRRPSPRRRAAAYSDRDAWATSGPRLKEDVEDGLAEIGRGRRQRTRPGVCNVNLCGRLEVDNRDDRIGWRYLAGGPVRSHNLRARQHGRSRVHLICGPSAEGHPRWACNLPGGGEMTTTER